MYKENYNYYQKALLYCVDGNLQAVLDEYRFTINGKLGDKLVVAESNAVLIETRDSLLNKEGRKMYVRTHFATQYVDKVVTDNSTKQTSKMQDIFNSPFRPFVLATTSVGQEGLNFHWYARKLIHWNIPSNPVDMEQREGRVNRYGCHAVRRSVAALFGTKERLKGCEQQSAWNEMFKAARERLGSGYSEMVPYWCIPTEKLTDKERAGLEYVERIVPMFPYSSEHTKYERLMKVLSLYRLTMGQPRQEDILNRLFEAGLNEEECKELIINLSPFYKQ